MLMAMSSPCAKCGKLWPECECDVKPLAASSPKAALDKYFQKQIPKLTSKRRNLKPEKEVERACMPWMRAQGWDVQIYEAKNTYDPRRQQWSSKSMQAGTVDCQGLMPNGIFVAIEFKAHGKLRTFNRARNQRQKDYIIQKIGSNAFACVTDSLPLLQSIYNGYLLALKDGQDAAKQFLFDHLPGRKK